MRLVSIDKNSSNKNFVIEQIYSDFFDCYHVLRVIELEEKRSGNQKYRERALKVWGKALEMHEPKTINLAYNMVIKGYDRRFLSTPPTAIEFASLCNDISDPVRSFIDPKKTFLDGFGHESI